VAGRQRRYTIEYTDDAEADLDWFERHVQVVIDDRIERQLGHEPTRATRNRKPHRRSRAVPADWELRVGEHRVFYDVLEDERAVVVVAIGWKPRQQLLVRGRPVDDTPDTPDEEPEQ
jgi:mRNA-degrading endonuclease RelE of RelBE toxin-antitoxin system